ncbi:hypothetical protein H696_03590 [Fonticula alba]|uniref:Methyltransferase type 12 domain-containing protein n=1 Tax=Fonticula alba TaxID=691883 RepID=A0A058Z765_FONAL|nr:hypothetical protein H696_03590 [Fonticula alba]KCV70129.1 hypothetical protein H696_03590 [Fonticula alba]|eukprot:XP_009495735.1 hypothetical protein H696_03590 [Fonticula alba]
MPQEPVPPAPDAGPAAGPSTTAAGPAAETLATPVPKTTSSLEKFGNRTLGAVEESGQDIFSQNAWDNVDWTQEQIDNALSIVEQQKQAPVVQDKAEDYITNASQYWDTFYKQHEDRFFKDRHWLALEFPELFPKTIPAEGFTVFELGCGAGNTIFPLLAAVDDPKFRVLGCDFAESAVEVVRTTPQYAPEEAAGRVHAFVHDLTDGGQPSECFPPEDVPPGSVDVVVCIFVLSAIPIAQLDGVFRKIYACLKPGGVVLFRDYGRHDLAQLRFKKNRYLSDNFYVRGDGTCVYFFESAEVDRLATGAGFTVLQNTMDQRLLVNRARKVTMYRMWLQCKLQKPLEGETTTEGQLVLPQGTDAAGPAGLEEDTAATTTPGAKRVLESADNGTAPAAKAPRTTTPPPPSAAEQE